MLWRESMLNLKTVQSCVDTWYNVYNDVKQNVTFMKMIKFKTCYIEKFLEYLYLDEKKCPSKSQTKGYYRTI